MRPRSLRKTLRDMYPQRNPLRSDFPAELEANVIAHHKERYGPHWRLPSLWSRRFPITRYALGLLLLFTLLGGACQVPTSTQVEMGQHIIVRFHPGELLTGKPGLQMQLQEALAAAGAEKVRVALQEIDGSPMELHVLAWGQHVSPGDVEEIIQRQLGAENIITFNIMPLSGTVSETLGRSIGRRVFDLEVGGETAEELRAAILESLAAQGFDGTARVEVLDEGSTRKITVEAGTADGAREISNEIIIDKGDN